MNIERPPQKMCYDLGRDLNQRVDADFILSALFLLCFFLKHFTYCILDHYIILLEEFDYIIVNYDLLNT